MSGPQRHLSNAELLEAASRRAVLTRDFEGVITEADCAAADPHVVDAWLEAGRLTHLGMAPRRPR